jgi:hypothetical protein
LYSCVPRRKNISLPLGDGGETFPYYFIDEAFALKVNVVRPYPIRMLLTTDVYLITDSVMPENISQAKSVLSRQAYSEWHLFYIRGSCPVNCTKRKLTAEIRKVCCNTTVRRLACSVSCDLHFFLLVVF